MNKLLINLLPAEFAVQKKQKEKKLFLVRSSVIVLIVMILLTTGVFLLGISKRLVINQLNKDLVDIETGVNNLKDKEGLALILKNRLDKINALAKTESPESNAFFFISSLLTSDLKISGFTTEQNSQVRVSGTTNNTGGLERFINKLTDAKRTKGKITAAKLENLSRSADNLLSFELVITTIGITQAEAAEQSALAEDEEAELDNAVTP